MTKHIVLILVLVAVPAVAGMHKAPEAPVPYKVQVAENATAVARDAESTALGAYLDAVDAKAPKATIDAAKADYAAKKTARVKAVSDKDAIKASVKAAQEAARLAAKADKDAKKPK